MIIDLPQMIALSSWIRPLFREPAGNRLTPDEAYFNALQPIPMMAVTEKNGRAAKISKLAVAIAATS